MKQTSILDTNRIQPEQVKLQSKWLDKKIQEFSKMKLTPNSVLRDSRIKMVTQIMPGKLYIYSYDPKFKETLPYYDKFPLVIPFSKNQESFTGLNLHYLDYEMRMKLFQQLIKITNTKHFDDTTKLRYSWEMVKSTQKMRAAKPCVKTYLFEHLASPLGLVQPTDWHTVIMLPVQRFVGATKEQIWKENRKFK